MPETAEPIEIVWVVLALVSLAVSVPLATRALMTALVAEHEGVRELLRRLAWMRFRNEVKRSLVAGLVLMAGVFSASAPAPLGPSPVRWEIQEIWVSIALITLATSVWNEVDTRWVDAQLRKGEST